MPGTGAHNGNRLGVHPSIVSSHTNVVANDVQEGSLRNLLKYLHFEYIDQPEELERQPLRRVERRRHPDDDSRLLPRQKDRPQ